MLLYEFVKTALFLILIPIVVVMILIGATVALLELVSRGVL